MVVLTMVRIIWKYLGKVRVEAETEYGSDNPTEMVVKYLFGKPTGAFGDG